MHTPKHRSHHFIISSSSTTFRAHIIISVNIQNRAEPRSQVQCTAIYNACDWTLSVSIVNPFVSPNCLRIYSRIDSCGFFSMYKWMCEILVVVVGVTVVFLCWYIISRLQKKNHMKERNESNRKITKQTFYFKQRNL